MTFRVQLFGRDLLSFGFERAGDITGPAPEEPEARELFVLNPEVEDDREEVDELLSHLSDEFGFGWNQ